VISKLILFLLYSAGGNSQAFYKFDGVTDDQNNFAAAQTTGAGFAAFFFFCAFAIMVGAAFHISPLVTG
jgi:hypothetical protein